MKNAMLLFSVCGTVMALLVSSCLDASASSFLCRPTTVPPLGSQEQAERPKLASLAAEAVGEWHGFIGLPRLNNPVAIVIDEECMRDGGCQIAIGFGGEVASSFESVEGIQFDRDEGRIRFLASAADGREIQLAFDGVINSCEGGEAFIEGEFRPIDDTGDSGESDAKLAFHFFGQRDVTPVFDQVKLFLEKVRDQED